tara:strand:+ start:1098 stop:2300 length:1203 start_codon:yes stop_codon:yes gene_type:complete
MSQLSTYPFIKPVQDDDGFIITRYSDSGDDPKTYQAKLSTFLDGTEGYIPKFKTSTSIGDSIIKQSLTNPQISISNDPTYTSSARLDVDGTTRTKQLNVNSGKFFVNVQTGFSYIQANNYGQGNYFTTGQAVNQPKYIPAFGDTGKIIESSRYKTIKIENTDTTTGRLANGTVTGFTGTNTTPLSITLDVDSGTISVGDVMRVAQNTYIPNLRVASVTANGGVSFTVTFTGWPLSGVRVYVGNYIQFLTYGFDGVEIIPSPGEGSFNYVQELLFFYDNNGGQYNFSPNPDGNIKDAFIIKYADSASGTTVNRQIQNVDVSPFNVAGTEDWYMNLGVLTPRSEASGGSKHPWVFKNRAVLLQTDNIRGTTGGGSPISYIRMKYCVLNDDYSWIFNSDQTIS